MDMLDSSCLLCYNEREAKAPWEEAWAKKCAESVCKLLDFERELFQPFFEVAEYCRTCKGLIRDVDFMMRNQEVLQLRISAARTKLSAFLHRRLEMTFASENMGPIHLSEVFSSTVVKLEEDAESIVHEKSARECVVELIGLQSTCCDIGMEPESPHGAENPMQVSGRPRGVCKKDEKKTATNNRRFDCPICLVAFLTSSKLNKHKATEKHRRNISMKNTSPTAENENDVESIEVEVAGEHLEATLQPVLRRSLRNTVASVVVVNHTENENNGKEELEGEDSDFSFDVQMENGHEEMEDSEISEDEAEEESSEEEKGVTDCVPKKGGLCCSICLRVFCNSVEFLAHKRGHSLVSEFGCAFFRCRLSQTQFESVDALRVHVAESHNINWKKVKDDNKVKRRARKKLVQNCIVHEKTGDWARNETEDTFLATVNFLSSLQRHANKPRSVEPFPYACPFCEEIFPTGSRLDHHIIRVHEGDRTSVCCPVSTCLRRFVFGRQSTTRKYALDEHLRTAHAELIPQLLQEEEDRKKRVRIRDKDIKRRVSFFCAVEGCNRRSKSAATLEIHRLEAHEGSLEAHPCQDCGKKFRNYHALQSHRQKLKTHGVGLLCEHCGFSTATGYQLRKHIKNRHKHIRFSCSVCHLVLFVKEDVAQHETLHSKAFALTCVAYSCTDKGTEFENIDALRSHVARMHDSMKKEMICDICGHVCKGDGLAFRFKQHKRTHTAKQFQCRFCERQFAEIHQQQSHEEINHQDRIGDGEKKVYLCNLCEETFSARQYLYKHRAWHKHGANANLPKARQKKVKVGEDEWNAN